MPWVLVVNYEFDTVGYFIELAAPLTASLSGSEIVRRVQSIHCQGRLYQNRTNVEICQLHKFGQTLELLVFYPLE